MNTMRSKRGVNTIFYVLMALIIAAPVAVKFIVIGAEQAKSQTYLTNFYAQDLSLLVESLQSVPGDVQILYPLEEGFTVKLDTPTIKVIYDESGKEKTSQFHLLPGTRVETSEATGYATLTKTDNTITLQGQNFAATADCPKAQRFPDPLSVDVRTGAAASGSGLSVSDLALLKNSLEHQLGRAGVTTDGSKPPHYTLRIESAAEETQQLIIKRRAMEGQTEANLQNFACQLKKRLGTDLPVKEDLSGTGDAVSLIFSVPASERQAFLGSRDELFTTIAETMADLGVSP